MRCAARKDGRMEFSFTPEQQRFRAEIEAFLKEALPAGWEGADNAIDDETPELGREFLKKLAPRRWIAPAWPVEYGGLGLSHWDQVIFNETMGYWRAPIINTAAVGYLGPTIILYGSDEQKKQHLPGITSGEVIWCQGYSEPNSGSDLASLQTRAVQDGDDFVINGQKIWTSQAHYADWMFLLARTDPEAPKHRGISYFLVDMKTPGITVRPLINMAGGEGFNEVFFENVRVPRSGLLGELNRGWYIATTTLDFERSAIGGTAQAKRSLEELTTFAKTESDGRGRRLWDNALVRHAIADLWISCDLAHLLSYRVVSMQARGIVPNYEASIIKVFNSEYVQRQARIGLGIMGMYGGLWGDTRWAKLKGRFAKSYVQSVGSAIAGGTSEIQRNIIAQRGLGLPRG
jgi:alkylation response protein AidB-like acyl-CoA dehydrogenase